jgi:hypothetical protein
MIAKNQEGPQSLSDYIAENYDGNQSAFARSEGVARSQVGCWIRAGRVVIDGRLYPVGRELADK